MNIHFNTKKDFQFIEVYPTAGALGAQIENVNLSEDLSEEVVKEIYEALLTYQVIFFRDQEFDPKSQKAFAKKIGKPIVYPFVKSLEDFPEITPILKKETDVNNFGGIWHSDTTYQEEPPMGTMLSMGMNSGYFQEATVHKPKGFDIKIDLAYVMFPPQRAEYEFIVPDTPIDVLFPLRFPKEKLQYKHPALLQYIPDTGEEGIYYDEIIAVTMPLNTLLFSEPVATIIGESIADTIEFNFNRANEGNALYNKMLERVWSEIEGIDGIGMENPCISIELGVAWNIGPNREGGARK